MKTCVDISDVLLLRAKKLAKQKNTTLKDIIECALRDILEKEDKIKSEQPLTTITFKGKGLQQGLSWDDWSKIRDLS